jgi:hypothetical protein
MQSYTIIARAVPRIPTRLDGRVLSRDGTYNFKCSVTDLSERGARLATDDSHPVPKNVFLFVALTCDVFECEVRWRKGNQVGVQFIDCPGSSDRKALLSLCAI